MIWEWNHTPLGLASCPVEPNDPHRHRSLLGAQHQCLNLLFQALNGKGLWPSDPEELGSLADFSLCLLSKRDGIGARETKYERDLGPRIKWAKKNKGRERLDV